MPLSYRLLLPDVHSILGLLLHKRRSNLGAYHPLDAEVHQLGLHIAEQHATGSRYMKLCRLCMPGEFVDTAWS